MDDLEAIRNIDKGLEGHNIGNGNASQRQIDRAAGVWAAGPLVIAKDPQLVGPASVQAGEAPVAFQHCRRTAFKTVLGRYDAGTCGCVVPFQNCNAKHDGQIGWVPAEAKLDNPSLDHHRRHGLRRGGVPWKADRRGAAARQKGVVAEEGRAAKARSPVQLCQNRIITGFEAVKPITPVASAQDGLDEVASLNQVNEPVDPLLAFIPDPVPVKVVKHVSGDDSGSCLRTGPSGTVEHSRHTYQDERHRQDCSSPAHLLHHPACANYTLRPPPTAVPVLVQGMPYTRSPFYAHL